MSVVQFQVPAGAVGGQELQLRILPTRMATIVLPEDAVEGSMLQISVPSSTPAGWRDSGHDSSDEAGSCCQLDGPSYTSGDEDGSGSALLEPEQWHSRHVRGDGRCSRFRKKMRPYRTHYFNNQATHQLHIDPTFNQLIDEPISASTCLARVDYAEAAAQGLADWTVGTEGDVGGGLYCAMGRPVHTTLPLNMS